LSDLFIPKKIKVGFQKRDGTYTGQLAYVIYFDNKGVLRKEKSWEQWRDKKIDPQEFDNNPQNGFCLNKDVKRFNWSHFGSNRSYIRMYDPRGIEFEVTPENLIGILTETDCLKRGLEGNFVYAWKGTELVLLPCASEEYVKAKENTERQDKNIPAKELKPGCSYTTKKGEEVIYIGRFQWHEWDHYGDNRVRKITKEHVFCYANRPKHGHGFFKKGDLKFLATLNSPDAVNNYAELVDEWNADIRSSQIKEWEFGPEVLTPEEIFGTEKEQENYPYAKRNNFIERTGDTILFWSFAANKGWQTTNISYTMHNNGRLDTKTMQYTRERDPYYAHHYSYGHQRPDNSTTKEKILERVAKSVVAKLGFNNGKKFPITSISDVCR